MPPPWLSQPLRVLSPCTMGTILVWGLAHVGMVVAVPIPQQTDHPPHLLLLSPDQPPHASHPEDPTMAETGEALVVLLPLLILLVTMVSVLVIFAILVVLVRRNARLALDDLHTPADILAEDDARRNDERHDAYLTALDEPSRQGYLRSQAYARTHPPGSMPSDITLAQLLSIQEKGVSAWSFEPDYEANPPLYVEGRTEITFLADGDGLAPQEGGAVCVQSNLPIPKLNEVYYFECKMFNKPETTNVAVGLATKPYPSFRFPGLLKYSVGYFSQDGTKCHNQPWAEEPYSVPYRQGDVIGVGYRPRLGSVFFTRNGKRFEDAFVGLHRHNFFPTVAADGAAEVHVNLGQAGFVFIEANVKKWGLAPMVGNLPPPPAYGAEGGSVLIQTADDPQAQASSTAGPADRALLQSLPPPPPISPLLGAAEAVRAPLEGRITPHLLPPSRASTSHATEGEEDDDGMSVSSGPSYYGLPTPRASGMDISLHALGQGQAQSPAQSSREENHAPTSHGITSHTTTRATPRDYFSLPPTPPPYTPFSDSQQQPSGVLSALWSWVRPRPARSEHTTVSGTGALRLHQDPESAPMSGSGSTSSVVAGDQTSEASRVPARSRRVANALVSSLETAGLFEPLQNVAPLPSDNGPRIEPPPLQRCPGPSPATRRPSSIPAPVTSPSTLEPETSLQPDPQGSQPLASSLSGTPPSSSPSGPVDASPLRLTPAIRVHAPGPPLQSP